MDWLKKNMKKLKYLILLALLFCVSAAWSSYETIILPSEAPTNTASFIVTLAGCLGHSPPFFSFIGMEADEGEINLYVSTGIDAGVSVSSCYRGEVEIKPLASGNYTVNFYRTKGGTPFELLVSETMVVAKASDQEPALGHVIISGEAVEDQLLTASHGLSDRNGMGDIHYRWSRNGQPIPGAVNETYLLTDDDVNQDVRVTANYVDGLGKAESVSSLRIGAPGRIANTNDEPIGRVLIRGSVSEGSTLTIDTSSLYDADGMGELSYQWQRRYLPHYVRGPIIGSDSDTYEPTGNDLDYLITAIVSYTDQYDTRENIEANFTGRVMPVTHPVVVPPADLSMSAAGTLTLVDPGMAIAHDNQGGELDTVLSNLVSNGVNTPLPSNGLLYLRPGTHLLTWSVVDSDGLTGEAIQIVRVDPIIEFHRDRSSTPEGPFGCPLGLNGSASRYPVSVTYTLSGILMADGSEMALQEGVFQFDGDEQQATLWLSSTVIGDVADYESLLLVIDQSTHTVVGEKRSCRIVLSNDNFPPRIALEAYQQEVALRIVSKADGTVTVASLVDDLDIDDTHTYDWRQSDERLTDIDSRDDTLTFNPASLEPGFYRVGLRVSDGSAILDTELSIKIVDEHPSLTDIDSDGDGDGEPDQDEGVGDRDGDGIPNYLDHAGLQGNILPQEQGNATQYLMTTEPGLRLALGDIAFFTQRYVAMITENDIINAANSGLRGEADSAAYTYGGGLFDFRINGIQETGSSVKVVIPQQKMIEPDSVYRKLMPTGWQEFIEDSNNGISSAHGEAGQCPSPGDSVYTDGLTEGDWCVELTIEDGGPNDTDGQANGTIMDPGGVTSILSEDSGSNSNGGGGAFSLWMLFMIFLFSFFYRSVNGKA
ncbi:MAG: copper resistance protein CopC [Candidatus Thiodiazotropha sp. (ex Lucinoma borealis)]|nr:copper resistance protein CopC [Candidatus Thiodiazotropha sp. (ex Lucinoma borealis)]